MARNSKSHGADSVTHGFPYGFGRRLRVPGAKIKIKKAGKLSHRFYLADHIKHIHLEMSRKIGRNGRNEKTLKKLLTNDFFKYLIHFKFSFLH